jgi:hypothetical protein
MNTLVTAIYNHSPHSRIGGRGYSWKDYVAPFENLIHLGCNIVVYTQDSLLPVIQEYFSKKDFSNYKVVPYNLDNYKHSDSIYELKELSNIIDKNGLAEDRSIVDNDRNYHLCLSKTYFLSEAIKNNYFETENYYWIDGGLFHHGLFPESLGGVERRTVPNPNNYWPQNQQSLCNPSFFEKLNNKVKDKLLFIGIDSYYSRHLTLIESNLASPDKVTHVVGGIFGGDKSKVLELCDKFNDKISKIISAKILTLEEEVLSIIYEESFQDQGYIKFTHWGHDKPNERNYLGVKPGSNSFYKIFKDE